MNVIKLLKEGTPTIAEYSFTCEIMNERFLQGVEILISPLDSFPLSLKLKKEVRLDRKNCWLKLYLECSSKEGRKFPTDLYVSFKIVFESHMHEYVESTDDGYYPVSPREDILLFKTEVEQNCITGFGKPLYCLNVPVITKCRFKFYSDNLSSKLNVGSVQHPPNEYLSSDLKNLYCSKNKCDITIAVGENTLEAHQSILVARSPVLKAMLSNNVLEAETKRIEIKDTDARVFDCFLKYLYSAEIENKSVDMVCNLYILAEKYEVSGLVQDTRDILTSILEVGTACKIYEVASLVGDDFLKKKAMQYIKNNF